MTQNSKMEGHLVIERSQHKKINREIYTCVSILLFAGSPNHAGQACYGIQLYLYLYLSAHLYFTWTRPCLISFRSSQEPTKKRSQLHQWF